MIRVKFIILQVGSFGSTSTRRHGFYPNESQTRRCQNKSLVNELSVGYDTEVDVHVADLNLLRLKPAMLFYFPFNLCHNMNDANANNSILYITSHQLQYFTKIFT